MGLRKSAPSVVTTGQHVKLKSDSRLILCCWESRRDGTTWSTAEAVGKRVQGNQKAPIGATHGIHPHEISPPPKIRFRCR